MSLRTELEKLHRDELDAFVQEEFGYVYKDFSPLMTNARKISILIETAGGDESVLITRLTEWLNRRPGGRAHACVVIFLVAVQGSASAESMAEARVIRDALTRSKNGRIIDVQECRVETTKEIRDAIDRLKPQVVHIIMQGDERITANAIKTEAPKLSAEMNTKNSLGQAFAKANSEARTTLRLLTVSAHHSDEYADHLGNVAPCAIGMQGATSAMAERVFYSALYKAIGDGRSIASSFKRAQTELGIHDPAQDDRPIMFASNDAVTTETLFPSKWVPSAPYSSMLFAFVAHLVLVYFATSWLLEQFG